MCVCKDKIIVKLTGKYAEVAMDSHGIQTKMWKWSWTIMVYKLSFLSVSENLKEIRLCSSRQTPELGIFHI
jgi:hypothetical protein